MYSNRKNPMATRPKEQRDRYSTDDYRDTKERLPSGSYVSARKYSDGSSTYDFGICGKVSYDANGEEI